VSKDGRVSPSLHLVVLTVRFCLMKFAHGGLEHTSSSDWGIADG
jgi:hypothetical protein